MRMSFYRAIFILQGAVINALCSVTQGQVFDLNIQSQDEDLCSANGESPYSGTTKRDSEARDSGFFFQNEPRTSSNVFRESSGAYELWYSIIEMLLKSVNMFYNMSESSEIARFTTSETCSSIQAVIAAVFNDLENFLGTNLYYFFLMKQDLVETFVGKCTVFSFSCHEFLRSLSIRVLSKFLYLETTRTQSVFLFSCYLYRALNKIFREEKGRFIKYIGVCYKNIFDTTLKLSEQDKSRGKLLDVEKFQEANGKILSVFFSDFKTYADLSASYLSKISSEELKEASLDEAIKLYNFSKERFEYMFSVFFSCMECIFKIHVDMVQPGELGILGCDVINLISDKGLEGGVAECFLDLFHNLLTIKVDGSPILDQIWDSSRKMWIQKSFNIKVPNIAYRDTASMSYIEHTLDLLKERTIRWLSDCGLYERSMLMARNWTSQNNTSTATSTIYFSVPLISQASLHQRIFSSQRLFPEYYVVSFHGHEWKNDIREKAYVYRHDYTQRSLQFSEYLLKMYPRAVLHTDPNFLGNLKGKHICIRNAKPIPNIRIRDMIHSNKKLTMSDLLSGIGSKQDLGKDINEIIFELNPDLTLSKVCVESAKFGRIYVPVYMLKYNEEVTSGKSSTTPYIEFNHRFLSYYSRNEVRDFIVTQKSRSMNSKSTCDPHGGKFLGLKTKNFIYTTKNCFPYISGRDSVIATREFELQPIENAIIDIRCKTQELSKSFHECFRVADTNALVNMNSSGQDCADELALEQHVSMFTMLLLGIVDAQVNGGVKVYKDVFLGSEYSCKDQDERNLELLRKAIDEQAEVVKCYLNFHREFIQGNMIPLHEIMEKRFYQAHKSELSNEVGEESDRRSAVINSAPINCTSWRGTSRSTINDTFAVSTTAIPRSSRRNLSDSIIIPKIREELGSVTRDDMMFPT